MAAVILEFVARQIEERSDLDEKKMRRCSNCSGSLAGCLEMDELLRGDHLNEAGLCELIEHAICRAQSPRRGDLHGRQSVESAKRSDSSSIRTSRSRAKLRLKRWRRAHNSGKNRELPAIENAARDQSHALGLRSYRRRMVHEITSFTRTGPRTVARCGKDSACARIRVPDCCARFRACKSSFASSRRSNRRRRRRPKPIGTKKILATRRPVSSSWKRWRVEVPNPWSRAGKQFYAEAARRGKLPRSFVEALASLHNLDWRGRASTSSAYPVPARISCCARSPNGNR